MSVKQIVTLVLVVFVFASVGLLVYKESGVTQAPGEMKQSEPFQSGNSSDTNDPAETVDVVEPETIGAKEIENSDIKEVKKVAPESASERKTIAYYFYSQPRCVSCKKIEAFTDEAIRTGFEKELGSGALEWKLVDIKEPGNEHFVQDYQLYSKSVVLVNIENGEQSDWKNLQEVWNLLNDKQGFIDYIQTETRTFLEGNG